MLFQGCDIVWNLVLIEMHMLMVCGNGFSFIWSCFYLANVFYKWMKEWRKCCEVIWKCGLYNLNGNCPWRAWRLKGYAGICQREEMVKGEWEIWIKLKLPQIGGQPSASRPCVGQNNSNPVYAQGVVGPRAVSRRLADLRKKLKSSIPPDQSVSGRSVGRSADQQLAVSRHVAAWWPSVQKENFEGALMGEKN